MQLIDYEKVLINMSSMISKRAFTLIELLIVVAIIAILAAIAVPNFLEAQTRAKVSRFKADIRSAATAIEAYAVDHNKYPPPDGTPPGSDETISDPVFPLVADPPENYLTRRITTPIAYISSVPIDIFDVAVIERPGVPRRHAPHYINDQFNSAWPDRPWLGDETLEFFTARTFASLQLSVDPPVNLYNRSVLWHIHSHGPDLDHDDFLGDAGVPIEYDSSNGTISNGDIFYFGPGKGFTSR